VAVVITHHKWNSSGTIFTILGTICLRKKCGGFRPTNRLENGLERMTEPPEG